MRPALLQLAAGLLAGLGHGLQLPGIPRMIRFGRITCHIGICRIKHTLLRLLLLLLPLVLPMSEWCIFHLASGLI
ncbi:MAG: hypothetical protein HYU74_02185 [Dechloromonas sp.]|nr:hypothetical protein [Dechloromonas sp.]